MMATFYALPTSTTTAPAIPLTDAGQALVAAADAAAQLAANQSDIDPT